ncbi:hypothetical protein Mal64_14160 [Pseudobythopirellula maris]|uniref:DUF2029 domain-containing protein n=1 Tax=Pseudobythopirellula maris TaxID=2527991 RepID=A0A5C5ZVI1_9BACT|nr:hypothetical protein [Pseudobythopirellula maris]TWT91017.1 hypothetical protein Mal64_14160 [Pseudobythopirellula maris]
MSEILFQYEGVNPTSWAYLSSLLTIALFFKFNRVFCVRNFDLLLLVLLAPGLLCVAYGSDPVAASDPGIAERASIVARVGYLWLMGVNVFLLARMMLDSAMVRRPLLEPNLSFGGLTFLAASLLLFLTTNVLTGSPAGSDLDAVQRAEYLSHRATSDLEGATLNTHGPGFPFLFLLPHISTKSLIEAQDTAPADAARVEDPADSGRLEANAATARLMAILCQSTIVIGILLIARQHFDNAVLGVAASTLYLLLPYTAIWTGNVTHALPGALIVLAVLCYRRPIASGVMIGLACGTIYYPFALLPLWIAFYWRRGARRFVAGVVAALLLLVATLVFTSSDTAMLIARLQQMLGLRMPIFEGLSGVWAFWNGWYRVPLIVTFAGLSLSFAIWPAQKNLATLLSGTATLMVGVQFWHAHSGGIALAWYLPFLLLTVFRPNLEDRVAREVVAPSRWARSRHDEATAAL